MGHIIWPSIEISRFIVDNAICQLPRVLSTDKMFLISVHCYIEHIRFIMALSFLIINFDFAELISIP